MGDLQNLQGMVKPVVEEEQEKGNCEITKCCVVFETRNETKPSFINYTVMKNDVCIEENRVKNCVVLVGGYSSYFDYRVV